MTINRRNLLLTLSASGLAPSLFAQGMNVPGVSATEIKIGTTVPLSGPAAAFGAAAKATEAHFEKVNAAGGINGRKLKLLVMDDGYTPNRTVSQSRRLVEQDNVLMLIGQSGSATSIAARTYLNDSKVPQLFIGSGASTWLADIDKYPWSLNFSPAYRFEGLAVAKHILATRPNAKVGALYQNDDAGKGFMEGLRKGLASKPGMIVREVTAEATDPSVDSQVISLQASGADVMTSFNIPKATAQAIRRAYDIGWRPQIYIGSVSTSVPQVMVPAGLDKAKGVISAAYLKDPTDPTWTDDKGMQEFIAMMKKYSPGTPLDNITATGAVVGTLTEQLLRQCGADLSRANIIKQTMHLDVTPPLLMPRRGDSHHAYAAQSVHHHADAAVRRRALGVAAAGLMKKRAMGPIHA